VSVAQAESTQHKQNKNHISWVGSIMTENHGWRRSTG
jgi:hypothetical protein